MNTRYLFLPLVLATLFISTCSQTNEPKPPEYKAPREMTWTADTLIVPEDWVIQVLPEDMLVLSPDDIWLSVWVGHAQMWHYDGAKWENKRDIGGGINSIVRREGNDIWAGGYSGDFMLLAHYEGTEWVTYKMHQSHQLFVGYNSRNIQGEILDMCVDTDNNLWVCGRKGIIFKYDGINWDVDTVRIPNYPIDSYFLKSIEYFDGKFHILCSMFDSDLPKEAYFYITGDYHNWSVVDSMIISVQNGYDKWGSYDLFADYNENLFSYGQSGIWKSNFDNWSQILSVSGAISCVFSINESYAIAAGSRQKFFYYNGVEWNTVSEMLNIDDPYFNFNVCWTDGKEIFIGGYTMTGWPQNSIIWHGK